MTTLRVVDSITQLGPQDEGCLAVSGSHGGISHVNGLAPALGVRVRLVARANRQAIWQGWKGSGFNYGG